MSKTKKTVKNISSLLIFIICLILGIYWAYYFQDNYSREKIMEPLQPYNKIIYTDDMSNSKILIIEKTINELPDEIKEEIEKEWIICFTNNFYNEKTHNQIIEDKMEDNEQLIKNDSEVAEIAGLTLVRPRVIYLNTKFSETEIKNTLCHEIGHVISYKSGSAHDSTNFKHLYKTYKESINILDKYEMSDEVEWFAGLYEEYILRPNKLKETNTEVYNYMNGISEEFKNKDFLYELKVSLIGAARNITVLIENIE